MPAPGVREMDDARAAEIALIDNLQRADVPALEEAEAFSELLHRLGSIPATAAKVGKELGYVAKRLKLRALGKSNVTRCAISLSRLTTRRCSRAWGKMSRTRRSSGVSIPRPAAKRR